MNKSGLVFINILMELKNDFYNLILVSKRFLLFEINLYLFMIFNNFKKKMK